MSSVILGGIRFELDGLVRRAVRNARPRQIGGREVRWAAVEDAFGVGSTVAIALCRMFDVDPHEELVARECERCAEDYAAEQVESGVDLINDPPFACDPED